MDEQAITRAKKRDPYIDCIKALAITLIIITHDPYFVENGTGPLSTYLIDMAVPLFMLVSGINYAAGVEKRGDSIKQEYDPRRIGKKICRFLIPYTIVFFAVVILLALVKGRDYTPLELITEYIKGGYGPGAYYTPVIIQFVLVAPLMFMVVRKYRSKALILFFLINLSFEVALTLGMPWPDYARTLIRYFFIISVGMYIGSGGSFTVTALIASLLIGLGYLTYTQYISAPRLFVRWTNTSMMSAFYIVPIVMLIRKMHDKTAQKKADKQATLMGRIITTVSSATYHIYLAQMTYYYLGLCMIVSVIPVRIVMSIILCMISGVLYYYVTKISIRKRSI